MLELWGTRSLVVQAIRAQCSQGRSAPLQGQRGCDDIRDGLVGRTARWGISAAAQSRTLRVALLSHEEAS